MTLRFAAFLALICAFLAAACSDRLTSVPSAGESPHGNRVSVNVRVRIPPKTRQRGSHRSRFVASTTQGIRVLAYRANSAHSPSTLVGSLLMNLAQNSSSCMIGSNSGRICTGTIDVPPPAVDFEVTTWDQPPAAGAPAGKQLAAGSFIDERIKAGHANDLGLTVGGIPASLAVVLPSPTPVAGVQTSYIHGTAASNTTMNVNAYDADGNLILADDYADANGNDQSITLTVAQSATTCGSATMVDNSGTPSTTLQIASPQVNGIAFEYGQTALAQQFDSSSPCTFTFNASIPIAGVSAAAGAVVLTGPTVPASYAVTGKHGTSAPDGIVSGPDDNIWFADPGGEAIGMVPLANPSSIVEYEAGTSPAAAYGITVGSDNNLWFTENGHVGTFSALTPGTLSVYSIAGSPSLGEQMTKGPADVLEWFVSASSDQVYSLTNNDSKLSPYTPATPLPAGPSGIVADPSYPGTSKYALIVADTSNSTIDVIATDGTQKHTYALTGTAQSPQFVALDSGGNIWFTSAAQGSINVLTTGGGLLSFPITGTPKTPKPWGLALGPDGAMWFADCGNDAIARIPVNATNSSQITEYSVGAGAKPKWLTTGSDGALWFTDSGTGSVGRMGI